MLGKCIIQAGNFKVSLLLYFKQINFKILTLLKLQFHIPKARQNQFHHNGEMCRKAAIYACAQKYQ